MQTLYRVKGFIAHSEPDNFENGCSGKGESRHNDDFVLVAATLAELVEMLASEFCCGIDCVELDACETLGRIDVQVHQRDAFIVAKIPDDVLVRWHKGSIDLYLTDYSFYVERVQTGFSLVNINDSSKQG